MTRLDAWISDRVPPVPAGFASWMEPTTPDSGGSVRESLAAEAAEALARALNPDGRPRQGAFDLLAADGFLTWAAEAALGEDDVDAALAELIRRFGG